MIYLRFLVVILNLVLFFLLVLLLFFVFFFFKQKTAYEMRISDWSSDVCSSDLGNRDRAGPPGKPTRRATNGRRPVRARDDLDRQAQQCRQGARYRATGARHARRQRHLGGISGHAPCHEPRDGQHLRGRPRRSRPHPRPRHPRYPRVLTDRTSGVKGTSVSVREEPGGRPIIKTKN